MRRDLMADISHELRTLLAVLRGELEAIQDGVRRFTPESIPSLQAEVATLTKLVDDLHQLSMSDEGRWPTRKPHWISSPCWKWRRALFASASPAGS